MQENIIEFDVNENHDGTTIVERMLRRAEEGNGRSVYHMDGHTRLRRQTLTLLRTYAKKVGSFNGTDKTAFKFTLDKEVQAVDPTSSVVAPLIAEVSFSIPVGTSPENVLALRQTLVAVLNFDQMMDRLHLDMEY